MFVADKGHDGAAGTGPTGTSGTVEVVLVVGGGVEVHDAWDVIDVDSTSGNIGRDQRLHFPVFECRQRPFALRLRTTSMDGGSADADGSQLSGEPIGTMPGTAEHDGAIMTFDEPGG